MATIEVELKAATQAMEEAAPKARPVGLGALSYQTTADEVGDWNRFHNRRQISSYSGLVAGVSASGPKSCDLSITKHGNPRLRAALIEWAWRMVYWQPQAPSVQRWAAVLLRPGVAKYKRKKAIVALGRQLVVDLWNWRTGRKSAQELGWKMMES